METWCCVAATIYPVQTVAQHVEDAMGLTTTERFPKSPATAADQEGHLSDGGNIPRTLSAVFHQRGNRSWVNR